MKLYLSAGYTYIATNRNLDISADTKDNIYSIDLRWKGTEFMTVRTGYERLDRNSNFHVPADNPNVDGARNFDLADKRAIVSN